MINKTYQSLLKHKKNEKLRSIISLFFLTVTKSTVGEMVSF